jgi:predicted CopG family antitoxin
VYEKLSRIKDGRSFSELLEDLAEDQKVDLEDSFGAWSSEEAEDARSKVKEFEEDFESDFGEEVES